MEIPQIDNGKSPSDAISAIEYYSPSFPINSQWGDLALKYRKIIDRMDFVNLEIQKVYEAYSRLERQEERAARGEVIDNDYHLLHAEQVIYWLRKTADEIISLMYVLEKNTGKIEIDCIGSLFIDKKPDKGLRKDLTDSLKEICNFHLDFLIRLNEISNAYKHSFINSDIHVRGSDRPAIFALVLKNNDLQKNKSREFSSYFEQIIREFSDFYKYSIALAKETSRPRRAKKITEDFIA